MEDCVFCKIIKGDIASKKEFENEDVLAFHDINPQAPVHILVIPKKHIARLAAAVPEDIPLLGQCQIVAEEMAKKLGIGDAFRVSTSSGAGAGQEVFHLHYHLMGGWKDN